MANANFMPRPKHLYIEPDSGVKIVERIRAITEFKELSYQAKTVLINLIVRIGNNGYCMINIAELALDLKCERSNLAVVLKTLLNGDWITFEKYSKRWSFYAFGFRFTKNSLPEDDLSSFYEKYRKDGVYTPDCIFTKAERAERCQ